MFLKKSFRQYPVDLNKVLSCRKNPVLIDSLYSKSLTLFSLQETQKDTKEAVSEIHGQSTNTGKCTHAEKEIPKLRSWNEQLIQDIVTLTHKVQHLENVVAFSRYWTNQTKGCFKK